MLSRAMDCIIRAMSNGPNCDGGTTDGQRLVRLGLAMVALLAVTAIFFQIPALAGKRTTEVLLWLLVIGSLTMFARGFRLLRNSVNAGRLGRIIAGFSVAFGLVACCIPTFDSTDILTYVNIGWLQTRHGANPYCEAVCEIPSWQSDPMFYYEWAHIPSAYGFLFARLAKLVTDISGPSPVLAIMLFKAVNLLVYLATGWLLYRGLRARSCPGAERAMYLFLWNPLVLLQTLANGHNDLLMSALMRRSLWPFASVCKSTSGFHKKRYMARSAPGHDRARSPR